MFSLVNSLKSTDLQGSKDEQEENDDKVFQGLDQAEWAREAIEVLAAKAVVNGWE